jgi:t-SNARE complex subunit (syntaxin)
MWEDLATMDELQAEAVDRIAINMDATASNVDRGRKHLARVLKTQKKIRKRQACALCLVLFLALLVTGIGYAILSAIGIA